MIGEGKIYANTKRDGNVCKTASREEKKDFKKSWRCI